MCAAQGVSRVTNEGILTRSTRRAMKREGASKNTRRRKAETVPDKGSAPTDGFTSLRPDGILKQTSTRDPVIEQLRARQLKERSKIVLWKRPVTTTHYFARELLHEAKNLAIGLLQHRIKVSLFCAAVTLLVLLYFIDGPLQPHIQRLQLMVLWALYWVGLGILSSIGLGTGLHTFLLYLGPFIASVTLAAFSCNSVDFPSPPYPNEIICPEEEGIRDITFWTVMSKVRFEACMWGAGTALGELPPYFMARAARLSGSEGNSVDHEIESLLTSDRKDPLTQAKKVVYRLVKKVGFLGILLCASIPNPLFDLAGITCGHFLIPFWTFFGATLIGKAIIKTHIQKMVVILTFSERHFELAVQCIGNIPYVGAYIQLPFSEYLEKQKRNLHRKPGGTLDHKSSLLQQVFGYILLVMVVYFLLSIANSMAQSYCKRLDEEEVQKRKLDAKQM